MTNFNEGRPEAVDFPDMENTPEEVKNTPEYSIRITKSIIDKYKKGKTATSESWCSFWDTLRLYGLGRQPSSLYKTFLSGASATNTSDSEDTTVQIDARGEAAKGWYNIMWDDIVSFIPNLKSQIRGHFSEIDYDVKADNIDIDSGAEEERRMMELFTSTHPIFGTMINNLKQSAKIPIEEPEYIPEGLQELEDMKSEGLFKSPYTQQHEKLLLDSENRSNWDRFLKDQIMDDVMDIGYIFASVEYDDETCVPKWKYRNPKDVIIQYDHETGFQNSDYAGWKEKLTISQLKQYKDHIVNSKGENITEEEFKKIAKNMCGRDNNPTESEWQQFDKQISLGYAYDKFNVMVYKMHWKDVENIKRIKYINKRGEVRYYDYKEPITGEYDLQYGDNEIPFGKEYGNNYAVKVTPIGGAKVREVKANSNGLSVKAKTPGRVRYDAYYKIGKNEAIKKVRVRKEYYCWLIDNTDYCIKFGVMPNQPRYDYVEPQHPLVGYRLPEKAITFRSVPIENIYQIAWYRLQNGLAKAMQGVYAINTTLLGDNNKRLDTLKTLKAIRENQALFYKMSMTGNVGGTPIPLSYIPGNLGEVIQNEAAIMDLCMRWVENQTGFSMIALGQTPSPETGLGVTERSIQMTQKSIMPIMTALRYIKEELAKRTSDMWQLAIQNDEKARAEAAKIIGEDGVWILQQAKSTGVQYGIKLVSRPDSDMKAAIIRTAEGSAAKGEITADEKLFIIEQIGSGANLREMRMKLRKMIQKNMAMRQQMDERKIALQGQQIKEQAQITSQAAQQQTMAEIAAKDAGIKTQAIADIAKRDHDSRRRIEEEIAKYMLSIGMIPPNPKSPNEIQGQPTPAPPPVQQNMQQ